jgi:hypothetical protein
MSVGGGRLLRNKIRLSVGKDADTLRSPGAYGVDTPSNGPEDAGDLFVIFVLVGRDDTDRRVHQTAHSLEGNGDFIRYYDGSVWSEWSELGSGGGPGGETNLSVSLTSTTVTIENDNGDDAEIPEADHENAGVLSAADKELIDNLQSMAFEAAEDFIRAVDIGVPVQAYDSDLDAIAALTTTAGGRSVLTLADPNADRVLAWDDSASAIVAIALADIATEAAPDAGDYLLVYLADGSLAKVDWSNIPLPGTGISEVVEDTDPELGGDLDINGFDIVGTGNIDIVGSVTVSDEAYDATGWNSDLSVPTKNAVRDKIETLQPLDSDLTAIAALTTSSYGRGLLTLADDDALAAEISEFYVPLTGAATLDDDLGLTATSKDDGTKSSGTFTLDFSANFRHCVNNGAFTLAPPSSGEGMIFLKITNNSSAGAITTSGFTKKVGDDFTTTNGHVFFCTVARSGSVTMLSVTAMQ